MPIGLVVSARGLLTSPSYFRLAMGSRISPTRPQGYYIDLREKAVRAEWPPPWWPYPGWHRYIALGQWGLAAYERYMLDEGDEWLDTALVGGDHLVATQLTGKLAGAWHEPEDYPHTFQVPGPWVSAMAQGLCASYLARLYVSTNREEFAESARRAVEAMKIPTEAGGCSAPLNGSSFPEEYPTTPPSFVLNGAIYAVYGVIDVALATGDEAVRRRYTREGVQAVEKAVTQGYRDVVYLTTEVDLDPLRAEVGFGQVLEAIRRSAGNPSASEGR